MCVGCVLIDPLLLLHLCVQDINGPADVVEVAEGVVVANRGGNNLVLLSSGGKQPSVRSPPPLSRPYCPYCPYCMWRWWGRG